MGHQKIDTLTQRLDRLERENWWWKVLGVVAVAALGLVVMTGATWSKVPDEVKARKFVLIGEEGKRLGTWWSIDGTSFLDLHDKNGEVVVLRLSVNPLYGAEVSLGRGVGERLALLAMGADGSPYLRLEDKNGFSAVLGSTNLKQAQTGVSEKRPASSLVFFNKDGKVIWKAP